MYNTSFRIVNNTMEAEDIMQESFLDAFRKLDTFKGESSFGTWLKRIVVNKSLDAIKKKKLLLTDQEEFDIIDTDDLQETEILLGKIEDVKKALNQLPDQYRVILSLHLLEGYDHQEIAEILGISYNNVRVRYIRARNKLASKVNESNREFMNTLKN